MIRLEQMKRKAGSSASLEIIIAKALNLAPSDIEHYEILRKSFDARKKPEIYEIYSFAVALKNPDLEIRSVKRKKASFYIKDEPYQLPRRGDELLSPSPIVVGAGPAGLFAAYLLALSGLKPVVIERGDEVEERSRKVEEFWKTGRLDPDSNVSFGEGGAGTFSDGKLNTGVKDKEGRNRFVLETFVQFGAGEEILYDAKPHIGTDVLRNVVRNIREEIIRLGGRFEFKSVLQDVTVDNGQLKSVEIYRRNEGVTETVTCNCLILAIGHSARDTYLKLKERNFPLEPKAFAVGFRMEHSQDFINRCQYGDDYDKIIPTLPASPYKVTYQSSNGRGVYSFCMCPGGYIVNASSEECGIVVNGMSYAGRTGPHANSAIVVGVNPDDYESDDPLAGMYFQRKLEKLAYETGRGRIPIQYLGDYFDSVQNRYGIIPSDEVLSFYEGKFDKNFDSAYEEENFNAAKEDDLSLKGDYLFADLSAVFPKELQESFVEGVCHFHHIMPGFADKKTLLAGVESRTSAPVRIKRDEFYECEGISGIYPCGEGCGYAGGIMSAAMDGMKAAEAIIKKYGNSSE